MTDTMDSLHRNAVTEPIQTGPPAKPPPPDAGRAELSPAFEIRLGPPLKDATLRVYPQRRVIEVSGFYRPLRRPLIAALWVLWVLTAVTLLAATPLRAAIPAVAVLLLLPLVASRRRRYRPFVLRMPMSTVTDVQREGSQVRFAARPDGIPDPRAYSINVGDDVSASHLFTLLVRRWDDAAAVSPGAAAEEAPTSGLGEDR